MPVARLLAGIVVALVAPPACALDLTGPWAIHLSFAPNPAGFPITVTQSGSSLTMTVSSGATLSGTIDSATGAFTVAGGDPLTFSCAQLTGVAAPDGNSMAGTYLAGMADCGSRPPTCTCDFQSSFGFTACRSGTGLDCCGDEVRRSST